MDHDVAKKPKLSEPSPDTVAQLQFMAVLPALKQWMLQSMQTCTAKNVFDMFAAIKLDDFLQFANQAMAESCHLNRKAQKTKPTYLELMLIYRDKTHWTELSLDEFSAAVTYRHREICSLSCNHVVDTARARGCFCTTFCLTPNRCRQELEAFVSKNKPHILGTWGETSWDMPICCLECIDQDRSKLYMGQTAETFLLDLYKRLGKETDTMVNFRTVQHTRIYRTSRELGLSIADNPLQSSKRSK
jgi:hypothetical protein